MIRKLFDFKVPHLSVAMFTDKENCICSLSQLLSLRMNEILLLDFTARYDDFLLEGR